MDDFNYLCCNLDKCKVHLTDKGWVSRCMHIFCPKHGQNLFSNNYSQITCPICNEVLVKETDIAYCDINPSEMILAGLSPEKALALAAKSIKLWRYQSEAEHAYGLSQLNDVSKKYKDSKYMFEKVTNKMKVKHEAEVAGLKAYYDEIGTKLRQITEELQETKTLLKKYKVAYNSLKTTRLHENKYNYKRMSEWQPPAMDNIFITPPLPAHDSEFY